jgi:O-methyltransferase domain
VPPPQHSKPAVSGNPHRVRGGFFPAVPADDDASMTTSVVHDEDDDSAVQMLRHGRDAMPSHGRVLVLEIVVDPGQPLGAPASHHRSGDANALRWHRAHGAQVCYLDT